MLTLNLSVYFRHKRTTLRILINFKYYNFIYHDNVKEIMPKLIIENIPQLIIKIKN